MLFIEYDADVCITVGIPNLGRQITNAIMQMSEPETRNSPEISRRFPSAYGPVELHRDLCAIMGPFIDDGSIAVSNGGTAIFPCTLESLALAFHRALLYRVVEGQFHNRRIYYRALISEIHKSG